MFGKSNNEKTAVSEEQRRYLAFGAILFTQNGESCQTIKLKMLKAVTKKMLRNWWGIEDRNEALKTARSLSVAEGHKPFADDVYTEFILKGRRPPFTPKGLEDLTGLENAFMATVKRVLSYADVPDEAMTPEFIDEVLEDDEFRYEIVPTHLFERLTEGLECYKTAKEMLIGLGYTEQELAGIRTLAAWDYGRTAIIARDSAHIGYMTEDEAWQFLKTAAENAAGIYSGWHEYIAAYILGRAIAFGDDCADLRQTLDFLMNNDESPMRMASFI